ncbi:ABC transporter substrate-binding protein [Aminobacter aminovorans]|uniref:ABC transporter (Iron.B12.siderophore.hemin), periplasmic substrate-binding component n=1 Tax=Aminobacter aminovorans TaxID=83263 RepID=A0AAC9ATL8_AMIAI|nr:ABC transporter substrate-binding protein [Aminobacter aminovorans]AMS45104.1 ABC transporter (Iron.B12.siderophore.hemin), periplasmic substrate-binding component [Aminobacter aminovorans]MBB3705141.1 iron complex transport system substrate-binding protein [Aminobacter aminovorans]
MPPSKILSANLAIALCAIAAPTFAASTTYPLTIENCGVAVTFEKAPERAVALGQNSAEIMLLLGLEDRMVGTAFWPTKVLPELQEANDSVKLLSVETPSLESVLAETPDFVAAQLPILMGPDSKVAKREDFDRLGIGNYLAPSICAVTLDTRDAYGSRDYLWNMDYVYQEIDELSQIFDVQDRGQALIADFKAREVALRARIGAGNTDLSYVFWFSSPSPADDAYLGGKNGASGFIADLLGGHNAIDTEAEWPTVSWEGIMAVNPDVIVVGESDRNRWELDRAENKIAFLQSDPAVSQLGAVKNGHIVIMQASAMNPTIRTIYGAEEVADQLEKLGLGK